MEFGGQACGQHVIFEGSLAEMLRFWCSKLHFWRKSKSRRKASFLSFKASFLKEVSQKCFVFGLQSFNFEGSLAEKLRFWASKFHFWRKSRTKASFLIFKASILKEVSQKSFVFQLQSCIFEGSLAQKFRFWSSKLRFWRKSRRTASVSQWVSQLVRSISQSVSQSVSESVSESVSQIVSQSVSQSVSQIVSQVNQSVKSVSRSAGQLVNRSVSQLIS